MPNIGKPSRGCQPCKDRKVKCDEERPECRRCRRNGRQCSGYPTTTDVIFRNTLSVDVDDRQRSKSLSSTVQSRRTSSISAPMPTDWHGQSICMFFHDYVIKSGDDKVGFGFLHGLPGLLSKEDGNSAVQEAVSAVSLMSLAHRSNMDCLVPQARQRYGKALSLLAGDLRQRENLKEDRVLATILCMGYYEVVSGENPPSPLGLWSSHIDVLESLLHMRFVEQVDSSSSGDLSYNAHVSLVVRNLTCRIRPSKEAEFIARHPRRSPYSRQFGGLVCETCHLLADADDALRQAENSAVQVTALKEIIDAGIILDKKMTAWSKEASGYYEYTKMEAPNPSPPNTPLDLQKSPSIQLYSSATMAALWNQYRCMRILVLECLQKVSSRQRENTAWEPSPLDTGNSEAIDRIPQEIENLIDDVCASVPYLLGEVDQEGNLRQPQQKKAIGGFMLLWPLRLIVLKGLGTTVQRNWMVERLSYIRNVLGIYQATNLS